MIPKELRTTQLFFHFLGEFIHTVQSSSSRLSVADIELHIESSKEIVLHQQKNRNIILSPRP